MPAALRWTLGQHGVVLGQTGAGKTFGVKNGLLPSFGRIIIVDTEDYDFPERIVRPVSVRRAVWASSQNLPFVARIVMPTGEEGLAQLDELCEGLLDKGRWTLVYIDESTDFADATRIPALYRALARKARKRHISVLSGTQRPTMLSKDLYTLSVHRLWWYVDEYDCRNWLRESARPVLDRMDQIPYESYKWLYQGPDHGVGVYRPVTRYPWERWG